MWVVEVGIFFNYLGWGCVMPFEVIYLHDGRGFTLGVAGLVVGTVTGLAVVAAPIAGPLIDRLGARAVAAACCCSRTPPGSFSRRYPWPSWPRAGGER